MLKLGERLHECDQGRDAVLDIRISDRNLTSFYIITYYDNGSEAKSSTTLYYFGYAIYGYDFFL